MKVPSKQILPKNEHRVKNASEKTDREAVKNEQSQHDQPLSEGLWGTGQASQTIQLSSASILVSAPWKYRSDRSAEVIGLVFSGPSILETIYDPVTRTARFAVKQPGKDPHHAERVKDSRDRLFAPIVDGIVHDGLIILPSDIGPAVPEQELFAEVMAFLNRYNRFRKLENLLLAVEYALLTWRYDEFPAVPYLHVMGPAESGTRRFLKTMAAICYRATRFSGGKSFRAGFRLLDRFRGTAIIEEADMTGHSAAERDYIRTLICGADVDGRYVLLQREGFGDWKPTALNVFGPKILASRREFPNPTLENLCLQMELDTPRKAMPMFLPSLSKWPEARELRNKLLRYRLDHAHQSRGYLSKTFQPGTPPTLQQLVAPLKAVVERDSALVHLIDTFIGARRDELPPPRAPTEEIMVLEIFLARLNGRKPCTVGDLANALEHQRNVQMDPGKVGSLLRKLGLPTDRLTKGPTKGRWAVCANPGQIVAACERLGLEPPEQLVAQVARAKSEREVLGQEEPESQCLRA